MELFQIWVMPENKQKGSYDKWIQQDAIEAKCRKDVVRKFHESFKSGSWKVRKV